MIKKILALLIIFTPIFFIQNKSASAQTCPPQYQYCAICSSVGGACTITRQCPSGYRPETENFCQDPTGAECLNTLYSGCVPVAPPPSENCPADRPICSQLSDPNECSRSGGSVANCTTAGGERGNCCLPGQTTCPASHPNCISTAANECTRAGGLVRSCAISSTSTGNCCTAEPAAGDCGGHCQIPCGSVGSYTCTPPNSLRRMNDPLWGGTGFGCCSPSDPECLQCSSGSVPVPPDVITINDPRCGDNQQGIDTAIGCIPVGLPKDFVEFFLRWALGLGGLIAMILIIYSGFLILTSAGNPKQVAAGKELLAAAISGILLLALSAYLLRFIGVDVLGLPGF